MRGLLYSVAWGAAQARQRSALRSPGIKICLMSTMFTFRHSREISASPEAVFEAFLDGR